MGKPYREELERLVQTTHDVRRLTITPLVHAIEDCADASLAIVASGGSLTVAAWLRDLHLRAYGRPCHVLTPLAFQTLKHLRFGRVWFISAGGNNIDIIQSAEHALDIGCRVTVLSVTATSRLSKLADSSHLGSVLRFPISTGGDGFLATNSIWAMVLLLKAAYDTVRKQSNLASNCDIAERLIKWGFSNTTTSNSELWQGTNVVLLGDPYTMTGLDDLVIRCHEAALAHIWAADLRNFAHGRHFWFEARSSGTRALAVVTKEHSGLATRTTALLPIECPILVTPEAGLNGSLAALSLSMQLAYIAGRQVGTDPGRPGVPEFGEKIHELGSLRKPPPLPSSTSLASTAIERKLGRPNTSMSASDARRWAQHFHAFEGKLSSAEIRGLVFDFDGTLIETTRRYEPLEHQIVAHLRRILASGIFIGIATGRGGSCREELTRSIPMSFWNQVTVGYHNGAEVLPLDTPLPNGTPKHPLVARVSRYLKDALGDEAIRMRDSANQCSVTFLDGCGVERGWAKVNDVLRGHVKQEDYNIWMSSHSVDITPSESSKLRVVRELAKRCRGEQHVLRIGDRGAWPGNDWELLSNGLSVSVDQCSYSTASCWNLSPKHQTGVAALLALLERMRTFDGHLRYIKGN